MKILFHPFLLSITFHMGRFAQFGTICIIQIMQKNTHGGVLLLKKLQANGVFCENS